MQQPCAFLFGFILSSLDPCMDNKEWTFLEHLFMVAIIMRSLHSHPSPSRLWAPMPCKQIFEFSVSGSNG